MTNEEINEMLERARSLKSRTSIDGGDLQQDQVASDVEALAGEVTRLQSELAEAREMAAGMMDTEKAEGSLGRGGRGRMIREMVMPAKGEAK